MFLGNRTWLRVTSWPVLFFSTVFMVGFPHWRDNFVAWAQAPPEWGDESVIPVELNVEGRGLSLQASKLGNHPVLICEFVRNEIEYEAYGGSRFGAVGTLDRARGNDVDQSLLLTALLRRAYYNLSRAEPDLWLVRADVELSGEQALAWLGVEDGAAARSYLLNAGVEFTFTGNPDTAQFKLVLKDHVWVRGDLEFGSMQGTRFVDGEDGIRVDLDPSFVMQEEIEGAAPPFEVSGIDSDVFTTQVINLTEEDALEGSATGLPEAFMLDQSDSGAAVFRRLLEEENVSVEDALRGRRPTIEKIDALPDALPFRLASKPVTYQIRKPAELADFLSQTRHRVQVQVTRTDTDAVIADAVLPTSHLYESKLAIAFESDSLTTDELSMAQVSTAWESKSLTAKILLDGATPQVDSAAPSVLTTDTVTYATPVKLTVSYQPRAFGATPPLPIADTSVPNESFATRAGGFFVVAAVPSLNPGTQNEYYNASLSHSVATSGGGYLFQKPMTAAVGLGHTMDVAAQVMLAQTESFLRQGALATGHRVTTQGEWSLVGLEPVAYDDGSTVTYRTPRFVFGSRQGKVNLAPVVADADPQRRDTAAVQSLLQLTRDAMLTNGPDVALTGAVLPVSAGKLLRDANEAGHATFAVNDQNPEALGLVSERVATNTGDLRINLREDARGGALILLPSNKTMDTPTTATGALGSGWGYLVERSNGLSGTRTWSSDSYTTGGTAQRSFSDQLNTNKLTPGSLVYGGPCQAYQRLADQAIVGVEAFEGASIATGQAYASVAHPLATLLDRTDETQLTPARQATRVGSAVTLLHALLGEFSKPEVLELQIELYILAADNEPAQVMAEDEIFNPAFYEKIVATGSFNQMMEDFQFYAFDGPNNLQAQFPLFGEDPPEIDRREVAWVMKDTSGPTTDVFGFVTGYNPDSSDYNGPIRLRLSGTVYGKRSREMATGYEIDTAAPEVSLNEFDPAREYRGQVDFFGEIRDVNPKEYTVDMATGDPASGAWRVLNEGEGGFGYLKLASWDAHSENAIGTYTVRLNAIDLAGNQATTTTAFSVRNDNLPPTIAIEFPDQSPLSGTQPMRVVADDGAGSGLRKLKVWVDYERRDRSGAFGVEPRTLVLWEQDLPSTTVGLLPSTLSFPTGAGNYDFDTRDFQAKVTGPFTVHAKAVDEHGNVATVDETFTLSNALVEAYLTNGAFNPPVNPKTEAFVFFNAQASSTDPIAQVYELDENDAPTTMIRTLPVVPGFEDSRPVAPADAQGAYTHFQAFRWLGDDAQDVPVATGAYKIRVAYAGEQVDLDVLITTNTLPECYIAQPLYTLLLKDKTPTVDITGWIEADNLDLVDRDASLPIGNLLPAERPYWYLAYKPHSVDPVVNTTGIQSTFFSSNIEYEDNWTEIAHGFDQIPRPEDPETTPSTIATWNISAMAAGKYDLRLVVTDGVSLYRTCFIPGYTIKNSSLVPGESDEDRTVGTLKLNFLDLDTNFAGFPIRVLRSYNSARSWKVGDFGYGWEMDGTDLDPFLLTNDLVSFSARLEAEITLPDGRQFVYANNPPIAANDGFSNAWFRQEAFIDRPYAQNLWLPGFHHALFDGALDPLYGDERKSTVGWRKVQRYLGGTFPSGDIGCLQTEGGAFTLFDWDTGRILQRDFDGVKLDNSDRDTVRKVTYDYTNEAGGSHLEAVSDHLGRSVEIHRNSQNLIDWVEDAKGFRRSYAYENKNLIEEIDRNGTKTWFHYDIPGLPHHLTSMVRDRQFEDSQLNQQLGIAGQYGIEDEHDVRRVVDYTDAGLVEFEHLGTGPWIASYEDQLDGSLIQSIRHGRTGATIVDTYDVERRLISKVHPDGKHLTVLYNSGSEAFPERNPVGTIRAVTQNGRTLDYSYDIRDYALQYTGWGGVATKFVDFWINRVSGFITNDFDQSGSVLKPGYMTGVQLNPTGISLRTRNSDGVPGPSRKLKVGAHEDGSGRLTHMAYSDRASISLQYGSMGTDKRFPVSSNDGAGTKVQLEYYTAPHAFAGFLKKESTTLNDQLVRDAVFDYSTSETGFAEVIALGIDSQWMMKTHQVATEYDAGTSLSGLSYSDANDWLITSGPAENLLVKRIVDKENRLIEAFDLDGNGMEKVIGSSGEIAINRITAPQGAQFSLTYMYEEESENLNIVGSSGAVTQHISDKSSDGEIRKIIYPDGSGMTETFDGLNRRTEVELLYQGDISNKWRYAYDAQGELSDFAAPDGASTNWSFDPMGRIVRTDISEAIGTSGSEKSFNWDGSNRWRQSPSHVASGTFMTYRYQTFNKEDIGMTRKVTLVCYNDDDDNPDNDMPPNAKYMRFIYDSAGDQIGTGVPRTVDGATIEVVSRVSGSNADTPNSIIYNYNQNKSESGNDNVTYWFLPELSDATQTFVYPNGLQKDISIVTSTEETFELMTSFVGGGLRTRDIQSTTSRTTIDALGHSTVRTMPEIGGLRTRLITPEGSTYQWYDVKTDENDVKVTAVYEGNYPTGEAIWSESRSTENKDGMVRHSFANPNGTIQAEVAADEGRTSLNYLGKTVDYYYGQKDRILRVDRGDDQWLYSYNSIGRLVKVQNTKTGIEKNIIYTSFGYVSKITYDNAEGVNIYTIEYVTGDLGERRQVIHTVEDIVYEWNYSYDELERLKTEKLYVENPSRQLTIDRAYVYGRDSSLLELKDNLDPNESKVYLYEPSSQRLKGIIQGGQTRTVSWDANGQMTAFDSESGEFIYKWSGRGLLEEVFLPDGRSMVYEYGPTGFRTKTSMKSASGDILREESHLVSPKGSTGFSEIVHENIGGDVSREFIYGNLPLGEIISDGSESKTYYYLTDALGTILARVDSLGRIDRRYTYESFGERSLPIKNPGVPAVSFDGQFDDEMGFTGQRRSSSTRLQYHRSRWYVPELGIWASPDPVADFKGNYGHEYAYGGQNPVYRLDRGGASVTITTNWELLGQLVAEETTGAWNNTRHKFGSLIKFLANYSGVTDSASTFWSTRQAREQLKPFVPEYRDTVRLRLWDTRLTPPAWNYEDIWFGQSKENWGKYAATYINGMTVLNSDAVMITKHLANSYGIPVWLAHNPRAAQFSGFKIPTLLGNISDVGTQISLVGDGLQSGFQKILNWVNFESFAETDKAFKRMGRLWEHIDDQGLNLLHIAHSQGTIITGLAFALSNRGRGSTPVDQTVLLGAAFTFSNREELPADFHFVHTKGDKVFNVVGPGNWLKIILYWKRRNAGQISKILGFRDYSGAKNFATLFSAESQHTFCPMASGQGLEYPFVNGKLRRIEPNTYCWWVMFVGGMVFRDPAYHDGLGDLSPSNIHGEWAWLKQDSDSHVLGATGDWGYSGIRTAQKKVPGHEAEAPYLRVVRYRHDESIFAPDDDMDVTELISNSVDKTITSPPYPTPPPALPPY